MSATPFRPTPTTGVRRGRLPLVLPAIGVAGVALSAVYAATGLGLPCPWRGLTGWDCPLCGGTRMGAALLAGDPAAAFAYNPLVFTALPLATAVGVVVLVEWMLGRRGRIVTAVRDGLERLPVRITAGRVSIAAAVLLAAWTVGRNLVLGPLP